MEPPAKNPPDAAGAAPAEGDSSLLAFVHGPSLNKAETKVTVWKLTALLAVGMSRVNEGNVYADP
jgi:hypothetical protein